MIRLALYFIVFALAIWVGIKMHHDPGYVLVTYQHWSVETTLMFAVVALIVLFIVAHILWRLIMGAGHLSEHLHDWVSHRKMRKAQRVTSKGLCEYAEGQWRAAEKRLLSSAKRSEVPLINYLAAADAAQKRGEYERRDKHLQSAYKIDPKAEVAIGLTQAQLQLSARQFEQALATLRHVKQLVPHHAYVLHLLQKTYVALSDWESLQALLPELRKRGVLKAERLLRLERQVYAELLARVASKVNVQDLQDVWASLPKHLQKDPTLLLAYSDYLIAKDAGFLVERDLADAIKREWHADLVRNYGLLAGKDVSKQLSTAEHWLRSYGNNPALLLCLGRLCIKNKLWGKARDYLSQSLAHEPHAETYRELGRVLEELGEKNAALECYREGLLIV